MRPRVSGSIAAMPRKVWTAAQLDELAPTDVDALFEAGLVRDLEDVPTEHLARVREIVLGRIDTEESAPR